MTNINDLKAKLTSIADSIREKTGASEPMTLDEMKAGVDYMPSSADDNTFILVDEYGNELPAVLTHDEVDLTATANDIREGIVAVTDDGVIEGTKYIPSYHTYDGFRVVTRNSLFAVPHANFDYTKFQAFICSYNPSSANSVATIKVAVNDNVYNVMSTAPLSKLTKDYAARRVDFGITNDTGANCIIRYIMYKEIY